MTPAPAMLSPRTAADAVAGRAARTPQNEQNVARNASVFAGALQGAVDGGAVGSDDDTTDPRAVPSGDLTAGLTAGLSAVLPGAPLTTPLALPTDGQDASQLPLSALSSQPSHPAGQLGAEPAPMTSASTAPDAGGTAAAVDRPRTTESSLIAGPTGTGAGAGTAAAKTAVSGTAVSGTAISDTATSGPDVSRAVTTASTAAPTDAVPAGTAATVTSSTDSAATAAVQAVSGAFLRHGAGHAATARASVAPAVAAVPAVGDTPPAAVSSTASIRSTAQPGTTAPAAAAVGPAAVWTSLGAVPVPPSTDPDKAPVPGASADAAAATPATPAATAVAVPTPPGSVIQPVVPAPAQNVPAQATGTPMPVPLVGQVARPLFSLAAAGPGEHTLSISVTPDNLGPVVVRALITATGVRLELFAPTDLARDALRLILPDLRRDLAGGALPASLDLSSRSQPGDTGSSARQDRQAAADAFVQGGAAFGDGSRGGDQTRQPARGDAWLRPTPVTAIDPADSASEAVADGDITAGTAAGSAAGIRRGRVDVFA